MFHSKSFITLQSKESHWAGTLRVSTYIQNHRGEWKLPCHWWCSRFWYICSRSRSFTFFFFIWHDGRWLIHSVNSLYFHVRIIIFKVQSNAKEILLFPITFQQIFCYWLLFKTLLARLVISRLPWLTSGSWHEYFTWWIRKVINRFSLNSGSFIMANQSNRLLCIKRIGKSQSLLQ